MQITVEWCKGRNLDQGGGGGGAAGADGAAGDDGAAGAGGAAGGGGAAGAGGAAGTGGAAGAGGGAGAGGAAGAEVPGLPAEATENSLLEPGKTGWSGDGGGEVSTPSSCSKASLSTKGLLFFLALVNIGEKTGL